MVIGIILSIIFISLLGTLLHFLYDISNHNKFVGLFTSVNESTWEHIKIALTPSLLICLIDGYLYGNNPNYFFAKFISLVLIIILMPLLFYGYKFIFKKNNAIFNILIFYITVICSQIIFYKLLNVKKITFPLQYLSCIGLVILIFAYMILTLFPIKKFLFKDPITKEYGYKGHRIRNLLSKFKIIYFS